MIEALRTLVTPPARHYVIDSAQLAQVLRRKFYGVAPATLPRCDRCGGDEAAVTAGALNYCDDCWQALGTRTCLICGDRVLEGAPHDCEETP